MIRINEAELLRAGFPRDLVNALRELQNLTAGSVTQTDIDNLQAQITATDESVEQLLTLAEVRRASGRLSNLEQVVQQLRMATEARRPNLSPINERLQTLEFMTFGTR